MKMHVLAVGKKMPTWINSGYQEYAKRLNQDCVLDLIEIDTGKRSKKSSVSNNQLDDAKNIEKALPKNTYLIALDEQGKEYSTRQLANKLENWMLLGKDISFIIGGADGLHADILNRADEKWSLSKLTLPHPMVRIVLAEQLYRSWSLLNNHPYHRE